MVSGDNNQRLVGIGQLHGRTNRVLKLEGLVQGLPGQTIVMGNVNVRPGEHRQERPIYQLIWSDEVQQKEHYLSASTYATRHTQEPKFAKFRVLKGCIMYTRNFAKTLRVPARGNFAKLRVKV